MKDFFRGRTGAGLLHAAFALAVSLVLLSPMIFTGRTFGQDWTNHLWAMYVQGKSVAGGSPTLFMHTDGQAGVFYPHYLFYGGTLYTLGGGLQALLGGNAVLAYVVTWLAGFLMAYGGMLWLSFQGGLRGWEAHAAPIVVVTSGYYVAIAYAKGSWPELIAVSAIPLLLAATLSLLRSERVRLGPVIAFVVAAIVFSGSHNVTLAWGTVAIVALAVVGFLTIPTLRRIPLQRILVVLSLGLLAVAVNAWFLLPDVVYANRTYLGEQAGNGLYVQVSDWYDSPRNVFSLLRRTPPELAGSDFAKYPVISTQLPVLLFAWAIVVGALSWRSAARTRLVKVLVAGTIVLLGFMALLMLNFPWEHMPRALRSVQFTSRMEAYIVIVLGLLVAVLLRAVAVWGAGRARLGNALRVVLVIALAFGFTQAVFQAWQTDDYPLGASNHPTRSQVVADIHKLPPYWAEHADYGDISHPLIDAPHVRFDPHRVKDNRLAANVTMTPGSPGVVTDVAGGPYLVKVSGARYVGRSFEGFQVIAPAGAAGQAATIHVEPASRWPVVLGRWISLLALAGLAAVLGFVGYRSNQWRRRPV